MFKPSFLSQLKLLSFVLWRTKCTPQPMTNGLGLKAHLQKINLNV